MPRASLPIRIVRWRYQPLSGPANEPPCTALTVFAVWDSQLSNLKGKSHRHAMIRLNCHANPLVPSLLDSRPTHRPCLASLLAGALKSHHPLLPPWPMLAFHRQGLSQRHPDKVWCKSHLRRVAKAVEHLRSWHLIWERKKNETRRLVKHELRTFATDLIFKHQQLLRREAADREKGKTKIFRLPS